MYEELIEPDDAGELSRFDERVFRMDAGSRDHLISIPFGGPNRSGSSGKKIRMHKKRDQGIDWDFQRWLMTAGPLSGSG